MSLMITCSSRGVTAGFGLSEDDEWLGSTARRVEVMSATVVFRLHFSQAIARRLSSSNMNSRTIMVFLYFTCETCPEPSQATKVGIVLVFLVLLS